MKHKDRSPSPIPYVASRLASAFELGWDLASSASTPDAEWEARLREAIAGRISDLITQDMPRLKWILYRIDVSEEKLMTALAENPTDKAADVIAGMIIQREMEKARSRERSRQEGEEGFRDL